MKVILQRVAHASVTIKGEITAEIQKGLLVLVGIENEDNQQDIDWLASKIINLRVFGDANHVMNVSLKDFNGEILLVSQFTLHASTKKAIDLPIFWRQNQKLPFRCMKNLSINSKLILVRKYKPDNSEPI